MLSRDVSVVGEAYPWFLLLGQLRSAYVLVRQQLANGNSERQMVIGRYARPLDTKKRGFLIRKCHTPWRVRAGAAPNPGDQESLAASWEKSGA